MLARKSINPQQMIGSHMTIQIVSQYYYPDNFIINDIAQELAKRGHAVRVLTGLPDYATSTVPLEYKLFRRRKEIVNGVNVRRVPIIVRRKGVLFRALNYVSFAVTASIYALLSRKTYIDVIFANQTSPIFQVLPAIIYKWRTRKKLALYCYDLWPESMKAWGVGENNPAYRLVKKISRGLYRSCDVIAITSKPFRQYLVEVCGIADEKIVYLPQYAEDTFVEIVGQYQENGCVDFLFAGNIGAVQNLDCVLRAAALVNNKESFRVHIVGDGSELKNLKQMTSELSLDSCVIFHGRHSQEAMEDFYKMADCFLLTLRGGDFIGMTLPGKAQGYLCAGKPVLATIDGAGREMMDEADCGEVVPANNHIELAEKMKLIIKNFDRYKQKGMNGRRFYEAHFTKDTYFDSLLAILGEQ